MSKKNSDAPVQEAVNGQDLAQLRDILFGNQARATDDRLNDIESRLQTFRNELTEHIDTEIETLGQTAVRDLNNARQTLTGQLDDQQKDTAKKFSQTQERLDQITSDFSQKLKKAQQELQKNINQQVADLNRKLLDFQAEARRSDDNLRIEMLTLGAMLENQKAGRAELAAMLIQMGNQLEGNIKSEPSVDETEE